MGFKTKAIKKNIKIKKIIEVLNLPNLSKNKINFIEKMASYNLVNKGMVLNLFLYKKGFSSFNKGLKKLPILVNLIHTPIKMKS